MTQKEGKIQYFLGTNSAQGFISLYDELIDESQASAFYILKGGAGCGKSTLMKKIGEKMEEQGFTVEYILCSGDPDSLDGIYIPEKAVAIMDGTAPHGTEPNVQTTQHAKEMLLKFPMNFYSLLIGLHIFPFHFNFVNEL